LCAAPEINFTLLLAGSMDIKCVQYYGQIVPLLKGYNLYGFLHEICTSCWKKNC